jgi:hypothetical protein
VTFSTVASVSADVGKASVSGTTSAVGFSASWSLGFSQRDFGAQPFEETLIDGFRREFRNQILVGDMPVDDFLDGRTITGLGFDEQDRFSTLLNLPFPAVGAGDGKPIGANRQLLLKKNLTNLTSLLGRVQRDVENSHHSSR